MKNFKCPLCDTILNPFGHENITYISCDSSDHYFSLDFNAYINEPIGFYIVNYTDSSGKVDFLLEIININNLLNYYFRDNNIYRNTITLDNYILNDIYQKILKNELTKEYIIEIINKLKDLMLFV